MALHSLSIIPKTTPLTYTAIIEKIVKWFEDHHILFPWRMDRDPYKIWISEVMLQQTTVATVIPYFVKFIERFPTVSILAHCHIDEVLQYFQGLGYYRRAHLLHKGARYIMEVHGGILPDHLKEMLKVPGIGPYTARAILAIAHSKPYVPVDGNVIRVMARLFGDEGVYERLEKNLLPDLLNFEGGFLEYSPGFFAQGLMDLGREVCKPQNPLCEKCPISAFCLAQKLNKQHIIPGKKKKTPQPVRHLRASIYTKDGAVFMVQSGVGGLFPGLWSVPMEDIVETDNNISDKSHILGTLHHTLSHFKLVVDVSLVEASSLSIQVGQFIRLSEIEAFPTSTLNRKILNLYGGEREDAA